MCPEALKALNDANAGHTRAYGEDTYTERACESIREFFETDCEIFFVFNGTAANSLALASMCQSYHSVIAHESAHIETDECGAPEFFSNGTKLLLVPGDHGKVSLDAVEKTILKRTDIHYPVPNVLSVTQATELGTVYSVNELQGVGELARRYDLKLHMDGARLGNALVTLGVAPKEVTWKAGVDVLTFGGAKAGLAFGEAVVFFEKSLAKEFDYRCKQAGQLASKMRFITAPWTGLLTDGVILKHAGNANERAEELFQGLKELPGVEVMYPREANSVFIKVPSSVATAMRDRGWHFYEFIGGGGIRFMCSWDTTSEDVGLLIADFVESFNDLD